MYIVIPTTAGPHKVFHVDPVRAEDLRQQAEDKLAGDGEHGMPTIVEATLTQESLEELLHITA